MRILIVTAGSRGDIAPFTGLGRRLQQAGHQVALAAHDRFAELVRDAGLEHRLLARPSGRAEPGPVPRPRPRRRRNRCSPHSLINSATGVLQTASAGTDLLLTAFGPAPLSRIVAEGLGIPSAGVYLAPGVPTRDFAPPGWPATGPLSPEDNLAARRQVFTRTGALYADVLRRLRAELDLPRRRRARRRIGRSSTVTAQR